MSSDDAQHDREALLADLARSLQGRSPEDIAALLRQFQAETTASPVTEALFSPTPTPTALPPAPRDKRLLTIRVDIDEVTPPVWRRLQVRSDVRLDRLHVILQLAMGWTNSHLHRFSTEPGWDPTAPSIVTPYDVEEGEEGVLEEKVRLDQLLREPGDRAWYTYDFGDDWSHTLRVESAEPLPARARNVPPAVCLDGSGACPLEDVGGAHGHNDLVASLHADPSGASLEEYLRDWLPEDYDPTAFDLEETNALLDAGELPGPDLPYPQALLAILRIAHPDVITEVVDLCDQVSHTHVDPADAAAVVEPYRYLVDLAGTDGIPLTAAGWMRPAAVEQIHRDLGYADSWIGTGNREDYTTPIAQLREDAMRFGLLRKRSGRLLRTPLARGLRTTQDYLAVLVDGALAASGDEVDRGVMTLHALLVATDGDLTGHHADLARLLTEAGMRLSTGDPITPAGAENLTWTFRRLCWRAAEVGPEGGTRRRAETPEARRRVAALARAIAVGVDAGH